MKHMYPIAIKVEEEVLNNISQFNKQIKIDAARWSYRKFHRV